MPAVLTLDHRNALGRRLQRVLVWVLLVSLPAYGLSETLTQLLGPRHFHVETTAAVSAASARAPSLLDRLKAVPWVAELREMRERAHALSHSHALSKWARHVHGHAAEDDGVVSIDPASSDERASAEPVASVWALGGALRNALPSARTIAWPLGHATAFRSRVARLLERPPKR